MLTHTCTYPHTQLHTYSLNFHHPNIKGEGSIRRDLLAHSSITITHTGRECNPSPFIQTRTNQTSIHASYNKSLTQCNNVWSVVVKTTMKHNNKGAE